MTKPPISLREAVEAAQRLNVLKMGDTHPSPQTLALRIALARFSFGTEPAQDLDDFVRENARSDCPVCFGDGKDEAGDSCLRCFPESAGTEAQT